jgi:hypothetical protein
MLVPEDIHQLALVAARKQFVVQALELRLGHVGERLRC